MRILKNLLVPNRLDGIVLIVSLLAIAASVSWASMVYIPFTIANEILALASIATAVVAIGLAVCVGWGRCEKRRTTSLFIVCTICAVGPGLAAILIETDPISKTRFGLFQSWYSSSQQTRLDLLYPAYASLRAAAAILGLFASTIAGVWLFRFGLPWLMKVIQRFGDRIGRNFQITRPKLLIALAVILFLINTFINILNANGIDIWQDSPDKFQTSPLFFGIVFGILAFAVVVVWSSWCLLRSEKMWLKWTTSFCLIVLPVVYALNSRPNMGFIPLWSEATLYGIAAALFLLTIICLRQGSNQKDQPSAAKFAPSLWSLCPVMLLAATVGTPFFVDIPLLFSPYNVAQNVSFEDRLLAAWHSASLVRKTNGHLRGTPALYICNCDSDTDSDILSHIDFTNTPTIMLDDAGPTIDTSFVRKHAKQISISDSKLTANQLEDLLQNSIGVCFLKNLEIDTDDGKANLKSTAMIQLIDEHIGGAGRFLDAIESFDKVKQIEIYTPVFFEDWPAIVEASQECSIRTHSDLPMKFPENISKTSLKNITININSYPRETQKNRSALLRLIRDSDISIQVSRFYGSQFYWDFCFACPKRASVQPILLVDESVRHHHLAYGFDANDEITNLFVPGGDEAAIAIDLTELTSLSFDARWLNEDAPVNTAVTNDLSHLSKLVNLEELYLSDNELAVRDMSFLTPLKSLKHLQISAVNRSKQGRNKQGTVGFDTCPSLESITMFGKPDAITLKELQQLKKLEKLTFVDVLNDKFATEKFETRLVSLFPGVKIELIAFGKYDSDIPQDFQQHLKTTSKQIFGQLTK